MAYTFTWPKRSTFAISTSFNTTWVSYIYLIDANTHEVLHEYTNDDGGSTSQDFGINEHDGDLEFTIINYHKVNVSPGRESADDIFVQGNLANVIPKSTGGGDEITLNFSDGHGRPDNAVAIIQIARGPI